MVERGGPREGRHSADGEDAEEHNFLPLPVYWQRQNAQEVIIRVYHAAASGSLQADERRATRFYSGPIGESQGPSPAYHHNMGLIYSIGTDKGLIVMTQDVGPFACLWSGPAFRRPPVGVSLLSTFCWARFPSKPFNVSQPKKGFCL